MLIVAPLPNWAHLRAQVMLRVTDLDASIQYYTEALGMRLLRKSDNESQKYSLAFMGYADEKDSCVIELTYNWCGLNLSCASTGCSPTGRLLHGCPMWTVMCIQIIVCVCCAVMTSNPIGIVCSAAGGTYKCPHYVCCTCLNAQTCATSLT